MKQNTDGENLGPHSCLNLVQEQSKRYFYCPLVEVKSDPCSSVDLCVVLLDHSIKYCPYSLHSSIQRLWLSGWPHFTLIHPDQISQLCSKFEYLLNYNFERSHEWALKWQQIVPIGWDLSPDFTCSFSLAQISETFYLILDYDYKDMLNYEVTIWFSTFHYNIKLQSQSWISISPYIISPCIYYPKTPEWTNCTTNCSDFY